MSKEMLKECIRLTEERRANEHLSHQPLWELQDQIYKVYLKDPYPELCANVRCGISIGTGWIELFAEACAEIDALVKANPGFHVRFEQVKEKFGGLRAYTRSWSDGAPLNQYDEQTLLEEHVTLRDQVFAIIQKAEGKADVTCETCGEPGEIRTGGWMHVACDKHYRKPR